MNTNPFAGVVESLRKRGTVDTVFGDPVVTGEKTVIPVARVAYGFGGGYGSGTDSAGDEGVAAAGGGTDHTRDPAEREGEGVGVGGGIQVTPVGVVEITAESTRFVGVGDRRRALVVAMSAFALGVLVGRRRGRGRA
jgi:uncharacterized spore protein YtfJ